MIWYDQTTLSDKVAGTHGDCVRACYQTLLQDPLLGSPHPVVGGKMNQEFFTYLEDLGWEENFKGVRPDADYSGLPRVVLAAGPTIRTPETGVHHAVIYDRVAGKMLHDPHPSRAGLTEITYYYWLEKMNMNAFTKIRHANRTRQTFWPGYERASDLEFRTIEFAGEAGEVSDAVKKLIRYDRGIAGNRGQTREELVEAVREEVGDVLITLDMVADILGIDLMDAFTMKFNKTSNKVGIPVTVNPVNCDTIIQA